MPSRKPSKTAPAKEQERSVDDYLKECIAQGIFSPGQRVTESEVMRATGASRAKVRQAFQRLAVEGIMIIEEFRGASVKRLSKAEVIQLYEVREVLEGLAARAAAQKATARSKNTLVRLQAKMDSSVKAGDWASFVQLNQQWHQEITNAAENAYVREMMSRLNVPINRLLSQVFPKLDEIAAVNKEHREITAAIVDGAEESAEKLMRRHIRVGFLLRRLREAPDTN